MKAIAMLSGGLDSELATRIIHQQGIEIIALNFSSPFCLCNKKGGCQFEAYRVAKNLNIELKVIKLTDEYLEIVKNPKYGYGKNMNPCIDCRILMFKYARKMMEELNAGFLITGEVLGQRPKSQHLKALQIIEKESNLERLIVRPLSAKVLPITIPEEKGWIDREKLFAITGRQRKEQIKLAGNFDMKDYPCPSGGCLLTDKEFSKKICDLIKHTGDLKLRDVNLLKIGRHFRLSKNFKIIIGRNKEENEKILNIQKEKDYIILMPEEVKGPVGLGIGNIEDNELNNFVNILTTYCDGDSEEIKIIDITNQKKIIGKRLKKEELEKYRI